MSLFEDMPDFFNCLCIIDGIKHILEGFYMLDQRNLLLCQRSKNRETLLHTTHNHLAQLLQTAFFNYPLIDRGILEQIFHRSKPFFEPLFLIIIALLQSESSKNPT